MFEPAPDDVVLGLQHRAVALLPTSGRKVTPSLQELAYLGARLGPVLSRLAAVEAQLAQALEELEHTRPVADAALAWTALTDDASVSRGPVRDALCRAASDLQAWRTATGQGSQPQEWLIWSREYRSWRGPDGSGYTGVISRASRYSHAEAVERASRRSWRSDSDPPEVVVPAPPACLLGTPSLLEAFVDQHVRAATEAAVRQRRATRRVAASA